MSELVADCPRCGANHITFDVTESNWIEEKWGWQQAFETFSICRRCHRSTVFFITQSAAGAYDKRMSAVKDLKPSVNDYFKVIGHVSLKNEATEEPPEHLPANIDAAFREGATCMAVKCYNAAGTMFRLCLDFATKARMPAEQIEGLNGKIRGSLGLRLIWLFDTKRLPEDLRDLSSCVKEDGNDGAHDGTLSEADAADLFDFTVALLERLYTEPARMELAKLRRGLRRQ